MNQCSRCNKPCAPGALLCDECQNQLRGQFKHIHHTYPPDRTPAPQIQRMLGGNATQPHIALLSEQAVGAEASRSGAERIPIPPSGPPPIYRLTPPTDPSAPITSPQPVIEQAQVPYVNSTERVIDRLSEAAQRIAEEERTPSILHKRPHPSRLAPIRDISADIRRESTPLNSVVKTANPVPSTDLPVGAEASRSGAQNQRNEAERLSIPPSRPSPIDRLVSAPEDHVIDDHTPVSGQFPSLTNTPDTPPVGVEDEVSDHDLAQHMPDLWPWLLEADPEESDTDNWANRTDPLTLRHFPSSNEAARIEEEDIRRAMAEGMITAPVPQRQRRHTRSSKPAQHSARRLRIIFILLAILAVLALVVDGILLSAALLHPHRNPTNSNGPATLTVSQNAVKIGGTVTARISHFAPSTSVLLTHDIEEPVQIAKGPSLIPLDSHGNASVTILIDNSWGPGFHTLEAEDVTTRYTASTQLQILNAGETRPSHLLIDLSTTVLNMGADYEGTNTIKMLTLRNSGDGTPISWAASSNKSWLMISPTQGIFSESQTISVAVDRVNLKPGNYTNGVLTISSNVGGLPPITVQMSVKQLPPNAGPVLAVTPALLSFSATDGGANPAAQSLTISNPGTRPLTWSLTGTNPATVSNQAPLFRALGVKANWLSTNLTSGAVLPSASEQVVVNVNSRNLLPGTYTGTLVFSPNAGAFDKAQTVNVSLTVQPRCGLATSTGSLSFTAVAGQSNPANQALALSATASCSSSISWTAMSSASWLSVTPGSGHVNSAASTVTSIAVNTSVLPPGTYNAIIAFLTGQSTQSVAVQLTVQPQPPAGAPIIAVSGLTLNFSNTQGQSTTASQVVTITNNGNSRPLYWSTKVTQLGPSWLGASPTGGTIPAGKTGQLSVNVNTTGLTPGTYVGQIGLVGRDANGGPASGSPQTITVNLLVLAPCTLAQPSPSSLVFNATQGGANPGQQTVQITATGNCSWPLNWHASASASWLKLTTASNSIPVSGQPVSITVAPDIAGLQAAPAPYTAQVTITATDSAGAQAQGSPQVFSVSLNVGQPAPPCQLSISPTNPLAFTAPNPPQQTVTLSESGNCALPISWTAAADSASSSWLVLSPTSGSDTGTTSPLTVSVNAANLTPGSYTGQITISAKDAGGNQLQGSPQTLTVNLTVPGFSVSGSVLACSDPTCTNSAPLPGATVTVLNSLNNSQVATTTADPSGNYTLPPLAPGSYTVNVSGTDSNGNHYAGTATLLVTGDQTNFTIKAF